MLVLRLHRMDRYADCTMGTLYAFYTETQDDEFLCCTLEDFCRDTFNCQSAAEVRNNKVQDQTCIPFGAYKVDFQYSPKYKRKMLTVHNVPGFDGIRIHSGNTAKDSSGCILLGMSRSRNTVLESRKAVTMVENLVKERGNGEAILLIY